MMENEWVKRKRNRLENYDYSSSGAYFVTVCTKDRKRVLSDVIKPVGVGAHDDPIIRLTAIGKIVEKYLLSSKNIPGVKVDRYVIMPDHIHAILFLNPDEYIKCDNGSSKAPTPTNKMVPHIVSTIKRFCNKEIGSSIFQRGYMDHVIRDREDYDAHARYIMENPARWCYDELYNEE